MVSINTKEEVNSKTAIDLFNSFVEFMKERYGINMEDLAKILNKEDKIPITIFNDKLSSLESIVKYMKENLNMGYKGIAEVLYKNPGLIGVIYRNAKRKMSEAFEVSPSKVSIPFSAFYPELTVFESVVYYLKNNYNFNYRNIAQLLKRDERTIWTVYQRAKKKLGWLV
jgi:DNA-directed RNA polymerase specialized sigma24 family protein